MSLDEVRAQLEEDLAWRLDELRHLRNQLLGELDRDSWPAHALRAILVMQYAHLEGYARNAFSIYVHTINQLELKADRIHPNLFASAMTGEFDAIRFGNNSEPESEDGRLTRRARIQVKFVEKLRELHQEVCLIDVESAVSMDMNFGSDVLRRTLIRLGIPETVVHSHYFVSLEFVRTTRNDIAHGSRVEKIPPGRFEAHQKKCVEFMEELARLITKAIADELYLAATG